MSSRASDRRIMLLLLMVAAVTVADDPVQVLGPALANHLGVSQGWSGWFIAALGAGSVIGSLRRSKHLPSAPARGDGPRRSSACAWSSSSRHRGSG